MIKQEKPNARLENQRTTSLLDSFLKGLLMSFISLQEQNNKNIVAKIFYILRGMDTL